MHDDIDLGGFTIGEWKVKRELLKEDLEYSDNWEEAVDWYNKRLELRYFDPMRRIEENSKGEGFSLATIHCALIEHFASITQGKIHNHQANNASPSYEYRQSSTHFQDFLKNSYLFRDYFSATNNDPPIFEALDFYANVRCALLHGACTKNGWRINTLSCGHANPNNDIFTIEATGIKRLYRDILTQKLSQFLETYKLELGKERRLRLYFARSMDALCEIEPDSNNCLWWIDD